MPSGAAESAQAVEEPRGRPHAKERPAKQAKPAQPEPAVLKPTRLEKHTVLFPASPSPGAVFGCRVAAQVSGDNSHLDCYLASGSHVYHVTRPFEPEAEGGVDLGKEGVVLARRLQDLSVRTMPGPAHRHEVQSVTLTHSPATHTTWLGSIDCRGHALLRRIPPSHTTHTSQQEQGPNQDTTMVPNAESGAVHEVASQGSGEAGWYVLDPGAPVHEAGWAGVCMAEQAGAGGEVLAATALHFMRRLCVYQGGRCVRALQTLQAPTAVAMVPQGPQAGPAAGLLACAEEHQVSLWDVRQGDKSGLVQRLPVALGGFPLFTLDWCAAKGGLLGAAGTERAVTLLDPRKWRVAHKWAGATKYAIHYLAFPQAAPNYCYVSGLDYECVVGRWDASAGAGGSTGNANSSSGGHGRAVGPASFLQEQQQKQQQAGDGEQPAVVAGEERRGSCKAANISFRGDARWQGMAKAAGCSGGADVVVASTQAGSLFVLETKAARRK